MKKVKDMAIARKVQQEKKKKEKATERSLLMEFLGALKPGDMKKVAKKVIDEAMAGDEKAREFLGKYVLGGGKVSLDDLYSPPIVRRSRR